MAEKAPTNKDILEAVGQWSPDMEKKANRQKALEQAETDGYGKDKQQLDKLESSIRDTINEGVMDNLEQEFEEDELVDGDQALPDAQSVTLEGARSVKSTKSVKSAKSAKAPSQTSSKREFDDEIKNRTKDYVAATLTAWNNCPTIVKKQLDK